MISLVPVLSHTQDKRGLVVLQWQLNEVRELRGRRDLFFITCPSLLSWSPALSLGRLEVLKRKGRTTKMAVNGNVTKDHSKIRIV